MLLSMRIAATRSNFVSLIFRYGPAVAALVYPLALAFLHLSGRQFLLATDAIDSLLAGLAVCIAVALVCSVPVLSFTIISLSDRNRERLLAHLGFAAPPLFTLTGVAFFFLGIPNGDYVVWMITWLAALVFAAQPAPAKSEPAASASWIRSVHGIAAATIVLVFLIWHLANHVVAIWRLDASKEMMELLRSWYRSDLVQPVLVILFGCQLVTGFRLLWVKVAGAGDIYSSIQTATAAYLLVYIPSHLIAVFVLGRWFLGVDTTFAWASGAPSGLLLDSWNVRLIPHYSLAVLFVICHLAMGLRTVLLGHGIRGATADRSAWIVCSIGLAVSLVITIAQLKVGG